MNIWQITDTKKIEKISKVELLDSVDSAKVKINKVLLTNSDLAVYGGKKAVSLPIAPGRFAVGMVTEIGNESFHLAKNSRVYIKSLTNCGECYNCKQNNPENCSSMKIAGETADGFLQDYKVFPVSALAPLPDSVSDKSALYIDLIAMAIRIIDSLDVKRGDHVAIIGAKTLGNIIAQLLIYYQAVPIIIDSNDELLDNARNNGIYYAFNANTDYKPDFNNVTGGRNAEHTVYIFSSYLSPSIAFDLTALGGKVCFTGFDYSSVNIDMFKAYSKQLNLYFITNGFGNVDAAINLIANKAVKLDNLLVYESKFDDVQSAFDKYYNNMENDNLGRNLIINLI